MKEADANDVRTVKQPQPDIRRLLGKLSQREIQEVLYLSLPSFIHLSPFPSRYPCNSSDFLPGFVPAVKSCHDKAVYF